MYTASDAFFDALHQAGVTHCFVNLGSDHPSLIEAIAKGRRDKHDFPRIMTCPNEMVAMSMADGYARRSGKPQCVIVHVDVGTQGLAAAMHNASVGRAPVLVFAGLSPYTLDGERRGSRTEYIHWLQDVPDQKQIVAQYCRYVGEIKTGANVRQLVHRALQFATSDPQGPVYLCAAREVMAAAADVASSYAIRQDSWSPVRLGGLPGQAARDVAEALADARRPLLVTGFAGRDIRLPKTLAKLADLVPALQVLDTGGSDMSFPGDHPACLGMRLGVDDSIEKADVIVVLNCDVPWIPTQCKPRQDAIIFHIDVDPLKQLMALSCIHAWARFRADAMTAIEQITENLETERVGDAARKDEDESRRLAARQEEYDTRLAKIRHAAQPLEDDSFGTGHLCRELRDLCPEHGTIWAVEAVTNAGLVHDNIQPSQPGSWINCGGGGLGWSGGGALGIKLAADAEDDSDDDTGTPGEKKLVVQIVGDGSYMFSVPSSVYWISMRYKIPILTIVLNNNGWNAPHDSDRLMYPDGLASKETNAEINIAFVPSPDYSAIARAAGCGDEGDIMARRVSKASELKETLREAIAHVQSGRSAVVDCAVVNG